jgi:hypothetical protein
MDHLAKRVAGMLLKTGEKNLDQRALRGAGSRIR